MPFIFALFLVSGVSFQAQAQESLPALFCGHGRNRQAREWKHVAATRLFSIA